MMESILYNITRLNLYYCGGNSGNTMLVLGETDSELFPGFKEIQDIDRHDGQELSRYCKGIPNYPITQYKEIIIGLVQSCSLNHKYGIQREISGASTMIEPAVLQQKRIMT